MGNGDKPEECVQILENNWSHVAITYSEGPGYRWEAYCTDDGRMISVERNKFSAVLQEAVEHTWLVLD